MGIAIRNSPARLFHAFVVDLDVSMIKVEEPARPLSQRVGTGLAGRALRPLGKHGAPDTAAQSGHNAAGAAGAAGAVGAVLAQQATVLRVQSKFTRQAFDAVAA